MDQHPRKYCTLICRAAVRIPLECEQQAILVKTQIANQISGISQTRRTLFTIAQTEITSEWRLKEMYACT
jgi:hypothetical protein